MPVFHVSSDAELRDLVPTTGGPTAAVIDFYATWCGPCKRVAPAFEALADDISKRSHNFSHKMRFLKVDVDAAAPIASTYAVTSMPTFVIVENGGKEVHRVVGGDIEAIQTFLQDRYYAKFAGAGHALGASAAGEEQQPSSVVVNVRDRATPAPSAEALSERLTTPSSSTSRSSEGDGSANDVVRVMLVTPTGQRVEQRLSARQHTVADLYEAAAAAVNREAAADDGGSPPVLVPADLRLATRGPPPHALLDGSVSIEAAKLARAVVMITVVAAKQPAAGEGGASGGGSRSIFSGWFSRK